MPIEDVDLAGQAGLGDRAAPARPERADGVGVVDHQHRAVAARELAQPAELRDVAVHREEAVGDDQAAVAGQPAEAPGEVLEVAVAVDERLGPGEAAAVDDARVIELVGEDDVAAAGEGGDDAGVGEVARSEQQRRLGPVEVGEVPLELVVGLPCCRRSSRDAPAPVPQRSVAAIAAAVTSGWAARLR